MQPRRRPPRPGPPGGDAEKKSAYAAERDRPDVRRQRRAWRARAARTDPGRYIFLDESGATTRMTRTHGRAPRGARVRSAVPHGRWEVATLTAAVRRGGGGACRAFPGGTDTACFVTYVERCLAPALRPGDIVVMDNLAVHKAAAVAAAVRAAGAEVRYLPPYSPDLNPIEEMFSKVKAHLRGAEARTVEALYGAMGEALRAVTARDIDGWFQHCGYGTRKRKPL